MLLIMLQVLEQDAAGKTNEILYINSEHCADSLSADLLLRQTAVWRYIH